MKKTTNLEEAIDVIRSGGVVVFPTDTVYGFLCDASNKTAVEKIFKIKGRDFQKPISVFVKDVKMAKEFAFINEKQEGFLKKVWPGNVTVVLKSKNKLHNLVLGENETIGLRMPNYKVLNELLNELNIPLAQTSVNLAGEIPLNKPKEIIEKFKNQEYLNLVFDGGEIMSSKPSTVIDLSKNPPVILREGAVSKEELFKIF